jgi:hypothetical protein
VRKALDRLSDAQHACFALQSHSRCLLAVYTVLEQEQGVDRKAELEALLRLYRHVDGIKGVLCRSVAANSPEMRDADIIVKTTWANTVQLWWRTTK